MIKQQRIPIVMSLFQCNSRFSHDVTTAMLVPLNKEKAAMLVPDQILREFNSIIMQTLPFVFVEKHGC